MITQLSRNWWALVLRGAIAVLFGTFALARPDVTLASLIVLFGFFAIVDGAFALVVGIGLIGGGRAWGGPVFGGLFGIGIGVATFVWPGLTALTLLYLIAYWAIVTGIMQIAAAVQMRAGIPHPALFGFSGVWSALFGALLIAFPRAGALSVIWLIGTYALIFGVSTIILGLRLRGMRHMTSPMRHAVSGT